MAWHENGRGIVDVYKGVDSFKNFIVVATACFCAGAASAQSVSSGLYWDGNIQGEYLSSESDSSTVGCADFTLGYNGATAGSIPFGFELDVATIHAEDFAADPHFTGSIFYESAIGRLSIGLPRIALDDYVATPSFGGSRIMDLGLGFSFKSIANAGLLYGDASFDYGVRFDGTAKGVDFGLSYHQFNETESVVTGAVRYGFLEIYIASAGFEYFDEPGTDPGVFGSLEADYGIYGALLSIASPTGTTEVVYAAEMFYEPSENIDFVTGYASYYGENLFSFEAKYTFLKVHTSVHPFLEIFHEIHSIPLMPVGTSISVVSFN